MTHWQRTLLALVYSLLAAAPAGAQAPGAATASSEWGPGYGADAASDGLAGANGNYWQTVQGQDKGAWWRVDLGRAVTVRGLRLSWARHQDKVHCPPARMVVQTSLSGRDGSWHDVRAFGPEALPRDGEAYGAGRPWRCAFPRPVRARCLRLVFPEGSQPGARYPGYLCLGEVEADSPELAPRLLSLSGAFGRAELDARSPSMARLWLRGPKGLSSQSVLAQHGRRPWARRGYTYVVGTDGKRYESRLSAPRKVQTARVAGRTVLRIAGVKLCAGPDQPPVALEDWTLSAVGPHLVWSIRRRWQRDLAFTESGSPGLFFAFDARSLANSVTTTLWHDPLWMDARPSALYRLQDFPARISENHVQTIRDRNTWAVYKLWTNWHSPMDLRLEVRGGNLYRRGSFAWLGEAGAVTALGQLQRRRKGQVEEITLRIGAVDKRAAGHQLALRLPDKATETALTDFYGSVLNGGAVNDQKGFDFGNESDGWYYAGSAWMYGVALAAGVPAPGRLSSRPYDAARAFREHLAHILATLDDHGRAHFGYNQGGEWVDDNLHTILGTYQYLLHTGDLAFVRQHLPALERMLAYFTGRRDERGLFRLEGAGAHWYYDAITTSGVNGYYNAFLYKAALDLADMEAAAGRAARAAESRRLAQSVKAAYNALLWKEDAPGGPRYLDWVDVGGKEVAYFCDLCQWPAVAVGIASPEQARKVVATADARIRELERDHGYRGYAGISAFWPVPQALNPLDWQKYGVYMNGGSLLCQTYWEIVARARAGDAEGAARRLKLFARRAWETSWAGDNAADIRGEMASGDGEPYLADMVAATAGAIHGVLGIRPTWQRLEVTPCLPAAWPRAQADVLYKGRRHRVTVSGGKATVRPMERVIDLPLLWVMDADLRRTGSSNATISGVDLGDGGSARLSRVYDDRGALGLWKLDDTSGPVRDASPHRCHGSPATQGITRGEPGHAAPGRSFRFDGTGTITIPDDGSLAFGPADSFTVQCWFRTEATDSRVMLGKQQAWCVYVKDGRLAAWLMQDGGGYREALGSRPAADGRWHHVAAVYDRRAQRLSVYLDGKLDTPDGQPGPQNPVDISPLGVSSSRSAVALGSLEAGFPFIGWIDEASVFRGALKEAQLGFAHDYPSPFGSTAVRFALSGRYVSPAYDWAVPARLDALTLAADLSGGEVTATVETSNDGFRTVGPRFTAAIRDGVGSYPLGAAPQTPRTRGASEAEPAQHVRVRLVLGPARGGSATPVVDGFRLTARPVP